MSSLSHCRFNHPVPSSCMMHDANVTAMCRESLQLRPSPGTRCFGCSSSPCKDLRVIFSFGFSTRNTSCWCRALSSSGSMPRHRTVPDEMWMAVHMSSIQNFVAHDGGDERGFVADDEGVVGGAEKLTDFFPMLGLVDSYISMAWLERRLPATRTVDRFSLQSWPVRWVSKLARITPRWLGCPMRDRFRVLRDACLGAVGTECAPREYPFPIVVVPSASWLRGNVGSRNAMTSL